VDRSCEGVFCIGVRTYLKVVIDPKQFTYHSTMLREAVNDLSGGNGVPIIQQVWEGVAR
jgi:hypothetical protein